MFALKSAIAVILGSSWVSAVRSGSRRVARETCDSICVTGRSGEWEEVPCPKEMDAWNAALEACDDNCCPGGTDQITDMPLMQLTGKELWDELRENSCEANPECKYTGGPRGGVFRSEVGDDEAIITKGCRAVVIDEDDKDDMLMLVHDSMREEVRNVWNSCLEDFEELLILPGHGDGDGDGESDLFQLARRVVTFSEDEFNYFMSDSDEEFDFEQDFCALNFEKTVTKDNMKWNDRAARILLGAGRNKDTSLAKNATDMEKFTTKYGLALTAYRTKLDEGEVCADRVANLLKDTVKGDGKYKGDGDTFITADFKAEDIDVETEPLPEAFDDSDYDHVSSKEL